MAENTAAVGNLAEFTSPNQFKDALYRKLKSTGLLNATKSELRTKLLAALRQRTDLGASPPVRKADTIQDQLASTLVAEWLAATQRTCTLSVFLPEAALEESPTLTHDDILKLLQIKPGTSLYEPLARVTHRDAGGAPALTSGEDGGLPPGKALLNLLLDAITTLVSKPQQDACTMTAEADAGHVATQLTALDQRYLGRRNGGAGSAATSYEGMAQKLADMQRNYEARVKIQVEMQVERIREIEIGQARLEEASKWRRAIASERSELERLYAERMRRLREQEEGLVSRVREQQRDIEGVAHTHRQRLLQEDERLRTWQNERERDLQSRVSAVAAREAAAEAREARCSEAEGDAERRVAEMTEQLRSVRAAARKVVEAELAAERADVRAGRVALEDERARVLAYRDEASSKLAAAAAKEDRLESLIREKGDAEGRAAAAEATARTLQGQTVRLLRELESLRVDLGRQARDSVSAADAVLADTNAAMRALDAEATGLASLRAELVGAVRERDVAATALAEVKEKWTRAEAEREALRQVASATHVQVQRLASGLKETQALLDEANAGRERAMAQAEECRVALRHAEGELREQAAAVAEAEASRDAAVAAAAAAAATGRQPRRAPSPATTAAPALGWAPASVSGRSAASEAGGHRLPPASAAPVRSTASTADTLVTARLEQLELEEAELQEEFKVYRSKLSRQQARLQDELNRVFLTRGALEPGGLDGLSPPLPLYSNDALDGLPASASTHADPMLHHAGASTARLHSVHAAASPSAVLWEHSRAHGFEAAPVSAGYNASSPSLTTDRPHAAAPRARSESAAMGAAPEDDVIVLGDDLTDTLTDVSIQGSRYRVPVGALAVFDGAATGELSLSAVQRYIEYRRLTQTSLGDALATMLPPSSKAHMTAPFSRAQAPPAEPRREPSGGLGAEASLSDLHQAGAASASRSDAAPAGVLGDADATQQHLPDLSQEQREEAAATAAGATRGDGGGELSVGKLPEPASVAEFESAEERSVALVGGSVGLETSLSERGSAHQSSDAGSTLHGQSVADAAAPTAEEAAQSTELVPPGCDAPMPTTVAAGTDVEQQRSAARDRYEEHAAPTERADAQGRSAVPDLSDYLLTDRSVASGGARPAALSTVAEASHDEGVTQHGAATVTAMVPSRSLSHVSVDQASLAADAAPRGHSGRYPGQPHGATSFDSEGESSRASGGQHAGSDDAREPEAKRLEAPAAESAQQNDAGDGGEPEGRASAPGAAQPVSGSAAASEESTNALSEPESIGDIEAPSEGSQVTDVDGHVIGTLGGTTSFDVEDLEDLEGIQELEDVNESDLEDFDLDLGDL